MIETSKNSVVHEILQSGKLPACPVVLTNLFQALEDPETTIADLARCLSMDQSLTIKVLRIVNSAFYGLPRTVRSVEEAAFRLGFREIWSLAVGVKMSDVYREAEDMWDNDSATLWHHSLTVGITARLISSDKRVGAPEELFTAGIIHDIGKLAFFCHDKDKFNEIYAGEDMYGVKLCAAEKETWGVDHAKLGSLLMEEWTLPVSLAKVVEYHHNPMHSDGDADPATVVLTLADALIHAAPPSTSGVVRIDFSSGDLKPELLELIQLDDSECVQFVTEGLQVAKEMIEN